MPYEFFLSYARENYNAYLKKFFKELSNAVRDRLRDPTGAEVGFFDQQLELGEEWNPALANALQTSKVLVCLYSPAYFGSEYCGKEWHVFHKRRLLYASETGLIGSTPLPPVIKPVIWVPFHADLPEVVAGAQYMRGNSEEPQNNKGLKHMRSMHNKYSSKYKEYVELLADEIVEAGVNYALPPLPELPSLEEVKSVFDLAPRVERLSSSQIPRSNLNHVKFVFVAGAPEHFSSSLRKHLDGYKQNGGRDWKPFFPLQQKPIRAFAQYIAAGEDLDFYSDELAFGPDLPIRIRDAENERSLVILLVDSWTAQLSPYKEILQELDELNYYNCSVLIPWNEGDHETVAQLEQLRMGIRETFRRWSRNSKSIYFRDQITSIEDLQEQLRDTLVQLQMEIVNDPSIQGSRPVEGDGPKTKPIL